MGFIGFIFLFLQLVKFTVVRVTDYWIPLELAARVFLLLF